jgi:hypothetical protein
MVARFRQGPPLCGSVRCMGYKLATRTRRPGLKGVNINWWTLGRELDQQMFEFRKNGMNGTPAERVEFLKATFDAARFNGRIAILAAPLMGKTPREVYDALETTAAKFSAEQAKETGFDDQQTEMHVEAHVKAYESLAEQFGFV